jgi:HEAT repeat protein
MSLGSDPTTSREALNLLMYHGPNSDAEAQTLWRLHGNQIISCWIRALNTKDNVFWKPYEVIRQNAPHFVCSWLPRWTEPQKVRELALWWLGEIHPEKAVPALCEVAVADSSRINRRRAVYAVGNIGASSEKVCQIMAAALVNEPDPAYRAHAVYWFKDTRAAPETAIPVLIKYLQDPNADLRRASAFALGAYGPQARPALGQLERLAKTADTYEELNVSWGAAWALKAIDPEAATRAGVK